MAPGSGRRWIPGAALAVGALLTVAGCGAGSLAQTSRQVSAVPGVTGSVPAPGGGRVQLLNVSIDFPGLDGYRPGEAAPLNLRISNEGTRPVTLVKVDAGDAATGATLVTGAATPSSSVAAGPSTPAPTSVETGPEGSSTPLPPPVRPSPGTQGGATQNPSPEAIPQPTTAPTPTGGAAGQVNVVVPPAGLVVLTRESGTYLQLTGLTRSFAPGESLPVTFGFDTGGTVTLPVPVGVPVSPLERPTPVPSVSEPAGELGSPTAQ